jgi:predicted secreted hydrolase
MPALPLEARVSLRSFKLRIPAMAAAALLVLLGGCATVQRELLPYNLKQHGTAAGEWGPHRGVMEWWYLTGVLEDGDGGPYLVQLTIFHFDFKSGPLYMLHLACTDYATDGHIFEQYVSFDRRTAFAKDSRITYKDSSIELLPDSLRTVGAGKDVAFDLTFRISDPPVWHGRDGIISMGHPEDRKQSSYYCSFVRLQTSGWLACPTKDNETIRREVSGWSWFDRQWGTFQEKGWDWFSLRFSDGDRIMLFCFPKTGHREGTWVRSDGTASTFSSFDYSVERWLERGGHRYGLDWQLELPVKGGRYRVEPLYSEDFNSNLANDYWEGLCRLLDDDGNSVGYCVAETTGPAHSPR